MQLADHDKESTGAGRKLGIQSVEIGAHILFELANYGRPATLSELSRKLDMAPSNVRRYLVSLALSGLIEQETGSLRYALGASCIRLGLLATGQRPEIELVTDAARALRDEVDCCVGVLARTEAEPVMINWLGNGDRITHVGKIGASFSLVHSASGRVILAHATEATMRAAYKREVSGHAKPTAQGKPLDLDDFLALLANIRKTGYSHVRGDYTPGIEAVAAPIFNAANEVTFVLSLVGRFDVFSMPGKENAPKELRRATERVSELTGYRGDATHIEFPDRPMLSLRDS